MQHAGEPSLTREEHLRCMVAAAQYGRPQSQFEGEASERRPRGGYQQARSGQHSLPPCACQASLTAFPNGTQSNALCVPNLSHRQGCDCKSLIQGSSHPGGDVWSLVRLQHHLQYVSPGTPQARSNAPRAWSSAHTSLRTRTGAWSTHTGSCMHTRGAVSVSTLGSQPTKATGICIAREQHLEGRRLDGGVSISGAHPLREEA